LGNPAKESNSQTLRISSPVVAKTARMRIPQPPRQTPVSTKSPGIPSSKTVQQQFSRFSKRLVATIVTASSGNLYPEPEAPDQTALTARNRCSSHSAHRESGRGRARAATDPNSDARHCYSMRASSYTMLLNRTRINPAVGAKRGTPFHFFTIAANSLL